MFWTRFNPFAQSAMQDLHSEMNRLFSRFNDGAAWVAYPAVNVWEEEETLHVEAELPGLDLSDLEIFVTGQNQLTIKGERKPSAPDNGTSHRQERAFGSFVRTLTLPFPVDDSQVEARLENGVLRVRLPKHAAARPRKITVKA